MIRQYLRKHGYNVINDKFYGYINDWRSWYEGKIKSFHNYTMYNGKQQVMLERYSLGMAKKVSEDWANLIMNEKVKINISDDNIQQLVDNVLNLNDFNTRSNELIELAFAMGTGAFVEYIDNENVAIDYIRADMIFPISWENKKITQCAFASKKNINGKELIYINLHVLGERGTYEIHNILLDSTTGNRVDLPDNVEEIVDTGLNVPSYQIIKPSVINNTDLDCPMGISVYANAIDVIKGIDLIYDSYINEFRLGKKRIIVPMTQARVVMEDDGIVNPVFDSNDVEFIAMDIDKDKGIKEINMELRAEPHEKALQRSINLLSSKAGLGNDRYNYDKSGLKTATEVISEKSDLYQNLKKNETVIEQALINMVKQIAWLSGYNQDFEINIDFDDSIIEDTNAIRQQALLEFQSGVIDVAEYLVITRKIDRSTAEDMAVQMQKFQISNVETDPFEE